MPSQIYIRFGQFALDNGKVVYPIIVSGTGRNICIRSYVPSDKLKWGKYLLDKQYGTSQTHYVYEKAPHQLRKLFRDYTTQDQITHMTQRILAKDSKPWEQNFYRVVFGLLQDRR